MFQKITAIYRHSKLSNIRVQQNDLITFNQRKLMINHCHANDVLIQKISPLFLCFTSFPCCHHHVLHLYFSKE